MIIFGEDGKTATRMVETVRTGDVACCLRCGSVVILERAGPHASEVFLADPCREEFDAILNWMGFPIPTRQRFSGRLHRCRPPRRRRAG